MRKEIRVDHMQKRALERDLRASGLSRSRAKLAVSRFAKAVERGQLKVAKGATLPAALAWLRGRSAELGQVAVQHRQVAQATPGQAAGGPPLRALYPGNRGNSG
eukprot:TRINITY_DN22997_c0_g1_i1.p2 TRINITY_DN22997_c0_g1~~TRINITY_DN22997_c0_g1_i1.p2  ORF type:complete len:104 (+),score=6.20 TRINITY_DN22997_c0_g1_i1:145-456(+)